MNTPHTLGLIGWSPDYKSSSKLPAIGELQPVDQRRIVRLADPILDAGIVGRWVACVNEMPDDGLTVIVWFDGGSTLAYHDSDVLERRKDSGWIMAGSSRVLLNVTHWCREVLPPNADVEARADSATPPNPPTQ